MDIKKKIDKQSSQLDKKPVSTSERIKPSGFIQRLKARIKDAELYQIYFVRAQQNSFSKGLTFLFIVCAVFGYGSFIFFLNPPIRFDEMKVTQGYVYRYFSGSRAGSAGIKIMNEKGEVGEKYQLPAYSELEQKLSSMYGELITIYYSDDIGLFLFHHHTACEIRYKNTYIYKYEPGQYGVQQMLYEGGKKTFISLTVIGFMSLFIVYLRHRKS